MKNISLILILLLAFIARFYMLGKNPPSLYIDEVSAGYNAYSILKTAKDEYGTFLPVFFRSLDVYYPGVSVYLISLSIAVFGLNEYGVRVLPALLGTISVLLTYFIANQLFRNKKIALLSSFLLAISPWHIHFSRFYHEGGLMIFFSLLGLYLLIESKNKKQLLYLSALSLGLGMFTFQGAKLWIPILIAVAVFFLRRDLVKFTKETIISSLIIGIFCLVMLVNFNIAIKRAAGVSIFNKNEDKVELFINGYLSHFSLGFLFMRGDTIGRHSVPGMGEMYVFELPLVLLGLFKLIRTKTNSSRFILASIMLAPVQAALATPIPHAGRSMALLPFLQVITAVGITEIIKFKWNFKFKKLLFSLFTVLFFYNLFTYFHLYYSHYPKEKALDWSDGHKEMVNFASASQAKYDSIYISNYWGTPYIYVLFYAKYPPNEYQKETDGKNHFSKYYFDSKNPGFGKKLVIVPQNQINRTPIKQFKMNNGDIVFEAFEE